MTTLPTKWEVNKAAAETNHARNVELGKQTNEFSVRAGEGAIKSATLLNGGAAVALLAFIGSATSHNMTLQVHKVDVANCFTCYFLGASASGLGSAFSYLTSYSYLRSFFSKRLDYEDPFVHETLPSRRWGWFGTTCHCIAILAVLISFLLFIYASWRARTLLMSLL